VNDVTKGVAFGPEITFSGQLFSTPVSTLRTGDLDGDGRPEIVGFNGRALSVATVDPRTFEIGTAGVRVWQITSR